MHAPDPISTRRDLLRHGALGFAALALGNSPVHAANLLPRRLTPRGIGPLGPPDANGVRLPAGFTSRIVAEAGARVPLANGTTANYTWHIYPDGGATFATTDGGWIYVSNSESPSVLGGGVGALRFDRAGNAVSAYRILGGTQINCAGGPTPWGTWLSCEEVAFGRVFECDPLNLQAGVARDALGRFKHEAAAVDAAKGVVYMTEDESDGRLYRFIPANAGTQGRLDLTRGQLQVARWDAATGRVTWLAVPNPTPSVFQTPTRRQVAASTAFRGGEGMWIHERTIYFTTKGDNRVWRLELDAQRLTVLYDAATNANPILTGVDNVTVGASGEVLVAEDGGDMQIVALDAAGNTAALLQVVNQNGSEITGPAFTPDYSRLYFSSQRGTRGGGGNGVGLTYEIVGPFDSLLG